jgi:transposase-like protein
MTDDICGHETTDGGTCEFKPKYPDGRCGHHTDEQQYEGGRPTKLSHQRQEQICQAIEQGKSITSAARMAGVDRTTVYGWIDRGEADKEADKENEFTEFYDRLTRAKGHGEDFYFSLALELAKENEDHRFIASLMKQRYPDSWGDTDTGVDADTVQIEVSERVRDTWPEQ